MLSKPKKNKKNIANEVEQIFNSLSIIKANPNDYKKINLFFEIHSKNNKLDPIYYRILMQHWSKCCFFLLDTNANSFSKFSFLQMNKDQVEIKENYPILKVNDKNIIGCMIGILTPFKPKTYQIVDMKIHPFYSNLRLDEYFHLYIEYNLKKLKCKTIQVVLQKEDSKEINKYSSKGYKRSENESDQSADIKTDYDIYYKNISKNPNYQKK